MPTTKRPCSSRYAAEAAPVRKEKDPLREMLKQLNSPKKPAVRAAKVRRQKNRAAMRQIRALIAGLILS